MAVTGLPSVVGSVGRGRPQPHMAGTYLAEQTSRTSYDLVGVHDEERQGRRATIVAGNRRRFKDETGGGTKITVLPALQSIDPLLGERPPTTSDREKQRQAHRTLQEQRIGQAVLRLQRPGNAQAPGEGEVFRAADDAEIVAQLTSLPWGRPRGSSSFPGEGVLLAPLPALAKTWHSGAPLGRCVGVEHMSQTVPGRGSSATSTRQISAKSNEDHHKLFRSAAHASGEGLMPSPGRQALPKRKTSLNPKRTQDASSRLAEMRFEVVPEDAVEAFFSKEREQERRAAEAEMERLELQQTLSLGVRERLLVNAATTRATLSSTHCDEAVGAKPPTEVESKEKQSVAPGPVPPEPAQGAAPRRSTMFSLGAAKGSDPDKWQDVYGSLRLLSPEKLVLCESVRQFIFGKVGNEGAATAKEREVIFFEHPPKDKAWVMLKFWQKMTEQRGRAARYEPIAAPEFNAFLDRLAWRHNQAGRDGKGTRALGEKIGAHLFGKKSFFQIEDLVKATWPVAEPAELKMMRTWMDEVQQALSQARVQTPPLLPAGELGELRAVFRYFDADSSGKVTFEELVSTGLLDQDTAGRYLTEFDTSGDGQLNEKEFFEMMCPTGYRPYQGSLRGTGADGQRVVFDDFLNGWRDADGAFVGFIPKGVDRSYLVE